MADEVGVARFASTVLDSTYRWLRRSVDGLAADAWYYQPSPDANSIAWLAWHLSRWKDRVGALVAGEPEVWRASDWASRFGVDAARTGMGDTAEQVAAFRPAPSLVLGYAEAVHHATVERVERLSPDALAAEVPYAEGTLRPAWQALASMVNDAAQHTGQIAYLRGVISGRGWTPY